MPNSPDKINSENNSNNVDASPSKRFFVEMLTRDIELKDSILDLLDNCIDGIVRTQKIKKNSTTDVKDKYEGFWAKITCEENQFVIQDNCGGIEEKILKEKAFKLGRDFNEPASDLATVGVYGIGMKRAIFKMGMESVVTTHYKAGNIDEAFQVTISPQWMKADKEWGLPLSNVSTDLIEVGTKIEVKTLRESIKQSFSDSSNFISELREEIATHYSQIMEMGFEVFVNGTPVKPVSTRMLFDDEKGISPFVFVGQFKDVEVELVVGLYREFPSEKDEEDDLKGDSAQKIKSGWTIIINDRVVLYQDRSILTGWGEAKVPSYHAQFSSIAGIVNLHSTNLESLPLTTTKRGLDASSPIYLQIKNIMRDGLKQFTDYTNSWKSPTVERKLTFSDVKLVSVSDVVNFVAKLSEKKGKDQKVKSSKVQGELEGIKYSPQLPKPESVKSDFKRISFERKKQDIEDVSKWLFDVSDKSPKEVGEKCFDVQFHRAKALL